MPDQGGPEWPEEDEQSWLASLEAEAESEPWDEEMFPDPDCGPPPDADLNDIITETDQLTADKAEYAERAARLGFTADALLGRRGPGQPGSAESFPGLFEGPGGGFAAGQILDSSPGSPGLACLADISAGDGDDYAGVSDDELVGILCAWERSVAHAAARRYDALAELMRRRPKTPGTPVGKGRLPVETDEFLDAEVCDAMAWSRTLAEDKIQTAWQLTARLPLTRAALRDGIIDEAKVNLIVSYTAELSDEEAALVEEMILDGAGALTLGGLRHRLRQAIIDINPGAAAKRRKHAEKDARVEMKPEASGNGSLAGRELPPAEVLAADQRVTWWARRLRAAGVKGKMDQLRARAYLDLLLGTDSRPRGNRPPAGEPRQDGEPAGPCDGPIPPGFTGQVNLTIPLTTLLGMSDRPADLGAFGPVDPDLARDVAAAAARTPKSTWCITVTDDHGHPIGHGCARAGPGQHPPGGGGFAFTARGQPGPPGGYGAWRLDVPGRGSFTVGLDPIAGDCDHRFQARSHDPGVLLQHLTSILHPTCTAAMCRRPARQCDYEHNTPYEAGGRTCLCNGDPKCRHDHRRKQDPRWKVEQTGHGTLRWAAPSGRIRETQPTRYPI